MKNRKVSKRVCRSDREDAPTWLVDVLKELEELEDGADSNYELPLGFI